MSDNSLLWESDDDYITSISGAPEVPLWIDQGITPYDVAGIIEGGCASGAYMPAVTYAEALYTMGQWGDEILDFISTHLGDEALKPEKVESWSGLAVYYLSTAVELWASGVAEELRELLAGTTREAAEAP